MTKQKSNKQKKEKIQLINAAIFAILLLAGIASVSFAQAEELSSLTSLVSQVIARASGKQSSNSISALLAEENQAAGLKTDIANLENQRFNTIVYSYLQNRSNAYINNIERTYDSRISTKERQLNTLESSIDRKTTQTFTRCGRNNNCIAEVALAKVATLTRRNFQGSSHSELSISNLDCNGGIIEDNLLFRYAYAIAGNNRPLTTSEAGRIANQFACLNERQTLLLDKALTRAVQQVERELESNPQAQKIFLMHALQPLLISLDSNLHLNPESLRFMEDHESDYHNLLAGETGTQLATQGIWLPDRTTGKFEQFNLCNSAGCNLGLDLIHSVNRNNLGVGDCTLGEMVKAGPVQGKGYVCDKLICEDTFDQGKIQQVIENRNSILENQGRAIDANPQQQAQQGLPNRQNNANQPQIPQLNNEGQTQYGTSIATSKDEICNKRRAQGRSATGTETPTSTCGINQNSFQQRRSNNQPYQCQKPNGQTKALHGTGNNAQCTASSGGSSSCGGGGDTCEENARLEREQAAARQAQMEAQERQQGLQSQRRDSNRPGANVKEAAHRYVENPNNYQKINMAFREALGRDMDENDVLNMHEGIEQAEVDLNGDRLIEFNKVVMEAMGSAADFAPENLRPAAPLANSKNRFFTALVREFSPRGGGTRMCADGGGEDSCSCNPMQEKLGTLEDCRSSPRRSGVVSGGPIRDPDRDVSEGRIGNAGNGIFSGLNSCFGRDRADGVPRSACEATRCPEGSYAVAAQGAFESCSCTQAGIREGARPGATSGGPIRDPARSAANIGQDISVGIGNAFRNIPNIFGRSSAVQRGS